MTFAITQHSWFQWHDQDGNLLFDDRDILFSATAVPGATSTTVTLQGTAYDIVVDGVDLVVDGGGQLSDGTGHTISVFDAATDTLLVVFSDMNLDIAGFRQDYEDDVQYPPNPDAAGFIFDASRVAAQLDGKGIGLFVANSGDDTMFGSGGSDELVGLAGDDRILGNGGNDVLWGDEGSDTLLGGAGFDDLLGGAGKEMAAEATTISSAVPPAIASRVGRGTTFSLAMKAKTRSTVAMGATGRQGTWTATVPRPLRSISPRRRSKAPMAPIRLSQSKTPMAGRAMTY
jgi:hypothetical protein